MRNETPTEVTIPALVHTYRVVSGPDDRPLGLSLLFDLDERPLRHRLAPSEIRRFPLDEHDALGETALHAAGSHEVSYVWYGLEVEGSWGEVREDREPDLQVGPVRVEAEPRPPRLPPGTPPGVASILREMAAEPGLRVTTVDETVTIGIFDPRMERLRAYGETAVDALLANLDHPVLDMAAVQLLGDLDARRAVPHLIDRLHMASCTHDKAIVWQLGRLTGVRGARPWYWEETRPETVDRWRAWWEEHREEVLERPAGR